MIKVAPLRWLGTLPTVVPLQHQVTMNTYVELFSY